MPSGPVYVSKRHMVQVWFVHEKVWDEPDLFPDHNEINSTAVMVHQ